MLENNLFFTTNHFLWIRSTLILMNVHMCHTTCTFDRSKIVAPQTVKKRHFLEPMFRNEAHETSERAQNEVHSRCWKRQKRQSLPATLQVPIFTSLAIKNEQVCAVRLLSSVSSRFKISAIHCNQRVPFLLTSNDSNSSHACITPSSMRGMSTTLGC